MCIRFRFCFLLIFAFVKERVHNAVEIDILGIFGRSFIVSNLASPKNSSGANSSGANDVIAIDHVLCLSHVFLHVSACLFVEWVTGNPKTLSEMKLNALLFTCVLCLLQSFRRDLNDAMAVYISEYYLACCFVIMTLRLFTMFTITTSKHLGFYMLTVSSFISFAAFWLYFIKFVD